MVWNDLWDVKERVGEGIGIQCYSLWGEGEGFGGVTGKEDINTSKLVSHETD